MKKVLFILHELNDDDVNWLIQTGRREELPPGTVLIHEGHPAATLYILLEGALVVSVSALEGRQIARLATGEVVGEMSFIDSRPPSATVQTLEESVVLAVPRTQLSLKLQEDVAFASRFYRALAILLSQRLRGTVKQLSDAPPKPNTQGSHSIDGEIQEGSAIAQSRLARILQQLQQ